jgi:hypothetical protein
VDGVDEGTKRTAIKLIDQLQDGGTYELEQFRAGRIVENIESRDLNRVKGFEAAVGEAVQRILKAKGKAVKVIMRFECMEISAVWRLCESFS